MSVNILSFSIFTQTINHGQSFVSPPLILLPLYHTTRVNHVLHVRKTTPNREEEVVAHTSIPGYGPVAPNQQDIKIIIYIPVFLHSSLQFLVSVSPSLSSLTLIKSVPPFNPVGRCYCN